MKLALRRFVLSRVKDWFTAILIFLFTIYCFYSYGLLPFFAWKTVFGGRLGYIGDTPYRSAFGLLLVLISFLLFLKKKKLNKKMLLLALWCFISTSVNILTGGISHVFSFEWLLYLTFICFVLVSAETKKRAYRLFYNIFVYTLLAPIIIYILVHIGLDVPYIEAEAYESIKSYYGISYRIYPFASQWTQTYNPAYYALRMCGIYNEPGVVGTFSALFLCMEEYKIKGNWKNAVLLIGGIFSFSLGFYALTAIFFVCRLVSLKKNYIVLFLAMVIGYCVFINVPFSDNNLKRIQNRLTITSEGLGGDNRSNDRYERVYKEFKSEGFKVVLFGKGQSAMEEVLEDHNIDGCSYKNLIYNYGILGFINQIIWIIVFGLMMCMHRNRSSKIYVFTCIMVFLANLYQRPSMFALQYLLIFVGGLYKKLDCGQMYHLREVSNAGN